MEHPGTSSLTLEASRSYFHLNVFETFVVPGPRVPDDRVHHPGIVVVEAIGVDVIAFAVPPAAAVQ